MMKVTDLEMIRGELQIGMNDLVVYNSEVQLSYMTLEWGGLGLNVVFPDLAVDLLAKISMGVINEAMEYQNFKASLLKPWTGFWSSFLPSDFLKRAKLRSGDQRERDRKPGLYDLTGTVHAQYFLNLSSLNFLEYERLRFLKAYPKIDDFLEKNLRQLSQVCDFFKLKKQPSLTSVFPFIETGGWISNDDSLVLLTRRDSARPTYRFRIRVEEGEQARYIEPGPQDIKEIRESIRKTGKASWKEKAVDWVIYDYKKGEPIVIPERFDSGNFKKAGAIIIFADYPKQAEQILRDVGQKSPKKGESKEEILAFMGDRAPGSAVSPLALTETYLGAQSPFEKIANLKDEIFERIKGKHFEMVLEFTFCDWTSDVTPSREQVKNVKIVGFPRPLA